MIKREKKMIFYFRHPFLLYPHFIDQWKKRLNKDDDSLIDDNEFETMFIDDLAFELLTMSLAALMILYMTLGIYIGYRRDGDKDIEGHLKPGMAPLALLGIVMLGLGFYGEVS